MKFAIKPRGIGKKPGARIIQDSQPLAIEETFAVPESIFDPSFVLAENETSLRAKTPEELAAEAAAEAAAQVERDAQVALAADAKADATFIALQTATPAQIATFVATGFPAFTAPQQAVIRFLLEVAALVIRRG